MVAMHTLRGRISSKLKVDTHTEGLPGDRHLEAIWGGGRRVEEGGRPSAGGGREGGRVWVCVVCWDRVGELECWGYGFMATSGRGFLRWESRCYDVVIIALLKLAPIGQSAFSFLLPFIPPLLSLPPFSSEWANLHCQRNYSTIA